MKKLIIVLAAFASLAGLGATAAQADPSVTICHDVHIVVDGSDVLNDASCSTAP